MNNQKKWFSIALFSLLGVALLGFTLRSKQLFSMPWVDFSHTLHAHSHFAFAGWITLVLMVLLVSTLLPAEQANRKIYQYLFWGELLSAIGMMVSFLLQGYALYSIVFSSVQIFITYLFALVFLADMRKAPCSREERLLAVFSAIYLVLSSSGPLGLAYMVATKSGNTLWHKDAIYTYLHLQYNGFFTLAVLALMFRRFRLSGRQGGIWFARITCLSIIPSLFLSYLWHYPGYGFWAIGIIGGLLLFVSALLYARLIPAIRASLQYMPRVAQLAIGIAITAFLLKVLLQAFTVFPDVGELVFCNRPVVIGFLHLVLLAFITLYVLGHMLSTGGLSNNPLSRFAITFFAAAVILNELILMVQGLGIMLFTASAVFPWLLWGIASALLAGALMLAVAGCRKNHLQEIP